MGFLTSNAMDKYSVEEEGEEDVLTLMTISLFVTPVILALSFFFTFLERVEGIRSARARMYLTLIRTVCLETVVLWTIVGKSLSKMNDEGDEDEDGVEVCRENLIGQVIFLSKIVRGKFHYLVRTYVCCRTCTAC